MWRRYCSCHDCWFPSIHQLSLILQPLHFITLHKCFPHFSKHLHCFHPVLHAALRTQPPHRHHWWFHPSTISAHYLAFQSPRYTSAPVTPPSPLPCFSLISMIHSHLSALWFTHSFPEVTCDFHHFIAHNFSPSPTSWWPSSPVITHIWHCWTATCQCNCFSITIKFIRVVCFALVAPTVIKSFIGNIR